MKMVYLGLAVCLMGCLCGSVFAGERILMGGWSETEVDNPEVLKATKFAVAERSGDMNMVIELVEILNAEQQVVAGMNYLMTLKVKEDGEEKTVLAKVWRKLDGEYELTEWSEVTEEQPDAR